MGLLLRLRLQLAASMLCLFLGLHAPSALALGKAPLFTLDQPAVAGVRLLSDGKAATIVIDPADFAGVARAAAGLQADLERVGGVKPGLQRVSAGAGSDAIIVGTLGQSALIDGLVKSGKLDVSTLRGKWEGYLIQSIAAPLPGIERALVIAGNDKRGTIYGIYEVSEQIGVSPWYWWADVPPTRHNAVVAPMHTRVDDAPVVRYRGIFLNDEAPALSSWTRERFGGFNSRFYERVFELILRLRGNYLWPAMWGNAFFDDDKENGRLADEMGIVMGTSHHEPMMRAQAEWPRFGGKQWDYGTNADQLSRFWTGGIANTRNWDKVVTMGMRGDGDEPMSKESNIALLERIVADQRTILQRELGRKPEEVPQIWALYKEVQAYYEQGMRVPDDITLLWCDDNWGNIRRLPTPEERKRAGGAGVYYHFDYVGGPRSYKWINVTPIPKIWEQMHLAYRHEANRMWIVNVGDLKPMEVPIEFFLTYAWNPDAWPAARLDEYLRLWATREFGATHAEEIAGIVAQYTRFNGRRKPEQLEPGTYSALHYNEAELVVADYNALARRAMALSERLPAALRDAFFQLVLHPVRASATLNDLYATTQMNRLYASQGRASAHQMAERARKLFALDAELTRQYHQDISGGKWKHMMSQTHIGYTSWRDPPHNVMPELKALSVPAGAHMGLGAEGSDQTWREGDSWQPAMPALDVFEKRARYIEVFNRGSEPFTYSVRVAQPWVVLNKTGGTVGPDQRIGVDLRWQDVPPGTRQAELFVTGPSKRETRVFIPVNYPTVGGTIAGHVETQGVVSIEAAQFKRAVAAVGREWLVIPGHGRTQAGVTTLPVTAPALGVQDGMRLEYPVHLFSTGKTSIQLTLAPTLKFQPGAGLRYAVSIDDEPPQVVNVHADSSERHWAKIVSDGAATFTTRHIIQTAGAHVVKVWALDPGLVIQKLVVDTGGLKPSYLGPPPSPYIAPVQKLVHNKETP